MANDSDFTPCVCGNQPDVALRMYDANNLDHEILCREEDSGCGLTTGGGDLSLDAAERSWDQVIEGRKARTAA